jgi:hypothetical protein
MAFGRPAGGVEESLGTRVQAIKGRLAKCNSIAEISDILGTVGDEELIGLKSDYNAARPGKSSKELALLHGIRAAIASEITSRKLTEREKSVA